MSSWKQYGGTNNREKSNDINVDYLSVRRLAILQPYQGNLIVNGSLQINDDINIGGNTHLIGNSIFENIKVLGVSTFDGIASFNSDFIIEGNINSKQNVNIDNNIHCGNIIYFNNDSQFIYGDSSGVGINTHNPNAALDISTNFINGIVLKSSQLTSVSTLVQNNQNQGILLSGNTIVEYIDFFNETPLNSNSIGDARISYTKGGILELDVSQNINLMSDTTISNRGQVLPSHIFNETLAIYDNSYGTFFGNIYNHSNVTGSALSLISNDICSNTFLHITTPNKQGIAIGGGIYPNDATRSMGFIGLSDSSANLIQNQTIVSGNDPIKYKSTVGLNTFQPKTEKYVVDINGPIHIDNGDITVINQNIPYQLTSMSVSATAKNKIIALGSSYDISGSFSGFDTVRYRERIILSNDFGSTWSQIDISNGLLTNKANRFTSVFTYDNSFAFISGSVQTILCTIDGGYTWKNVITIGINPADLSGGTYFNVQIGKPSSKTIYFTSKNNYFFADCSNLSIFSNVTPSISVSKIVDLSINNINAMTTNNTHIFLVDKKIIRYDINNNPSSRLSYDNSLNYTYNAIHCFNNTVIAVGNNIISSSSNSGTSWTDISFSSIQFNSVYCCDDLTAIVVGSQGNMWITQNSGASWIVMPEKWLNASGKQKLVNNVQNTLQNVVMSDKNTILVANTLIPYIQNSQYGSSEILNVFTPNFINRGQNNILDVSGNMQISGDVRVIDGGNVYVTGYSNFISDVSLNGNLVVNRNTKIYGSIYGLYDTSLNGNVVIGGNVTVNGYSNFISDVSLNGNLVVNRNTKIYGNIYCLSDTSLNGNVVVGGNVTVNGYSNFISDVSLNGNLVVNRNTKIYGSIYGLYDTSLNGNVVVGGNVYVTGYSNFISDVSLNGNLVVNRNTKIYGNIYGLSDTSLNGNVVVGGNVTVNGYSNFISDVSLNGNLVVNRSTKIYGNIYGLSDTSLNENVSVGKDVKVLGNVYINNTSALYTNNIIPYENSTLTIGYTSYNGIIRIGGPNDTLILQGNPIIEESPIINNTPTLLVNAGATYYASSGGSGLNIFDNSGLANYNPFNAGFIRLGNDLQSYIFKAPNIGLNGLPISGNTILRLGVNSLTLSNPITTNGLITLQRDSTYQATKLADGTSFGIADGATYSIVSYNMDVSNIMLKQYDSILGSQIVDTNLIIGNANINNHLLVYGNITVTKYSNFIYDVSLNGNLVVNRNTKIYGNIYGLSDTSLNGNVVVGGNVTVNGYSNFISDVSLNGNLVVNRNAKIYGNIYCLSDTSLNGNVVVGGNVTVNGYSNFISDVSLNGNLVVNRNAKIYGNIYCLSDTSLNGNVVVGGNVYVNGYSNFISDVSLNGNLVVNRNTKIYGSIYGLYDTSLNGNVVVGGNVYVNGYSNFISDVSLNGNLVVNRNTKIYGSIYGLYDTSLNGNVVVGGNVYVNGYSNFISDVSLNGNLVVNSNTKIYGSIYGLYDTSLNGNVVVGGNVTVNGYSNFISDVSLNGNLVVNRNTKIYGNIYGLSDTSLNGNVVVGGNVTVNGYSNFISNVSLNGNLVVNSNTKIYGSIYGLYDTSLNGNVVVGGNVTVNGYSNFISDVSLNGNLVVNRNTKIYGSIYGLYDTSLNGNVVVGGNVTVNGYSNFISDVSLNGNLVVNRNTKIYGNIYGLSDTSLNGNVVVGGNVTVNGYSNFISDVSLNGNLVVNRNTKIYGNIYGLSDTSLNGNVVIGGNVTVNGYSKFISDVSLNGNLVVNRNTKIYGNIYGLSDTSLNGNVVVGGNLYLNGKCGIGTISPSGSLHIYESTGSIGTANSGSLVISHENLAGSSSIVFLSKYNRGYDFGYIRYRDDLNDSINQEQGRLEIGTENEAGASGGSNDALILQKNGGYVGIGTSTPTYKLDVSGSVQATSYNATSDYRLKNNINQLPQSYSVDILKPVEYDLVGGKHDMGFLAHEVQEEFPFLVSGKKDGETMQSINYNGFIALLVKEIQDLKSGMKVLKEQIRELQNKP